MAPNKEETKECAHEMIGRGMIEHNGISHPGGEQICFDCKMSLKAILDQAYEAGRTEGFRDCLKEVLEQQLTNLK